MDSIHFSRDDAEIVISAITYVVDCLGEDSETRGTVERLKGLCSKMGHTGDLSLGEVKNIILCLEQFGMMCSDALESDLSLADRNQAVDWYRKAHRLERRLRKEIGYSQKSGLRL